MQKTQTAENKDKELQRLVRYLEQADSIHREAWWVVTGSRHTQGKTVFGKVHRALQSELKVKLGLQSFFKCDQYWVKREIPSLSGLPQAGAVYEKCGSQTPLIAEYEIPTKTRAVVSFYPQNLVELLGLASSIMSRKVTCQLTGDENGKLQEIQCDKFVQNRNSKQSVQFTIYHFTKSGRQILRLKGQVFEDMRAVKNIEAEVPLEGKIQVTETELQKPAEEKAEWVVPEPHPENELTPPAGDSPEGATTEPVQPSAENPQPHGVFIEPPPSRGSAPQSLEDEQQRSYDADQEPEEGMETPAEPQSPQEPQPVIEPSRR